MCQVLFPAGWQELQVPQGLWRLWENKNKNNFLGSSLLSPPISDLPICLLSFHLPCPWLAHGNGFMSKNKLEILVPSGVNAPFRSQPHCLLANAPSRARAYFGMLFVAENLTHRMSLLEVTEMILHVCEPPTTAPGLRCGNSGWDVDVITVALRDSRGRGGGS